LVNVPGYGSEVGIHPDLVMQGYHVLHISPMGYTTPSGPDESLKQANLWPVLPDTVASGAERGYKEWLINCLQAIAWAQRQESVEENRISFFGTSQGGGASLLLGSLFQNRGVRCVAADLPFLTNFPLANGRGAYKAAQSGFTRLADPAEGWRALGFIDTLSHARRLTIPVLLTAGELDTVTPAETIRSLYEKLPHTRSITFLKDTSHRYTREFMFLASAWFRMYS
jgi:cephalosporin-C deacetylase-like acetyl esterase